MQGAEIIHPKRILKNSVAEWLERPLEEEEILTSLKLCGKNKALGQDGFMAEFILNWECVKEGVLKVRIFSKRVRSSKKQT